MMLFPNHFYGKWYICIFQQPFYERTFWTSARVKLLHCAPPPPPPQTHTLNHKGLLTRMLFQ